jgi:hypothetical protein
VPSGSRPIPGFLRVATAALALTLAGGAARAQEANPEEANPLSSNHGNTSLREGQEIVPPDSQPPPGERRKKP